MPKRLLEAPRACTWLMSEGKTDRGRWPLGLSVRDRRWLGISLLLGLVVRVAYLIPAARKPLSSDAYNYVEISRNLVAGHGFSEVLPGLVPHATAYRPPGYPLLLAGVFELTGPSAGVARGLNLLLGLLVIVLAFLLVRRHSTLLAASIASFCVAMMPNLVANDVNALSDTLSLCFLLGVMLAVLAQRWWTTGVLLGLLILTRPSTQVFVLAFIVWVVVIARWKALGKVLLATGLIVSPWIIRNWVEFGSPVYVSSNGFNWAAIYSLPAQANGDFTDPIYDHAWDKDRLLQLNEIAWSKELQRQGIHGLSTNPTYVFHVLGTNAQHYLELTPSKNIHAEIYDGRVLSIVNWTMPIFYLELLVGLIGLGWCWRQRLAQLSILVTGSFGASSLLFISAPRLRAPVDLMLGIGCGLFAQELRERRAKRRLDQSISPASIAR